MLLGKLSVKLSMLFSFSKENLIKINRTYKIEETWSK